MMTSLPAPRARQGGLSLWDTLLLLAAIGGVLTAGAIYLHSTNALRSDAEMEAMLELADRQVIGFLAARGRLPCPDIDGDGREDCDAGNQTGWLPVADLNFDGSTPIRGGVRLRYVVNRTGQDLAVLSDTYQARGWDDTPVAHAGGTTIANDLDMCHKLAALRDFPDTGAAGLGSSTAITVRIAYGIAAPGAGDQSGNGNPFDGQNAAATPVLEPATRTPGPDYDDQVRFRTAAALGEFLGCAVSLNSIDAIALAVDVVNEVDSQKAWTLVTATLVSAINAVKTGVQIAKLVKAAMGLSAAITTLTKAVTALSSAIASCVALVGCALIPTMAAAVASATAAVAAGATALVATGLAVAALATATAMTIYAAARAGIAVGGGNNYEDALEQIETAIKDLEDEQSELRRKLDTEIARRNEASTVCHEGWANLYASVPEADRAEVLRIRNIGVQYSRAGRELEHARGVRNSAREKRDEAGNALNSLRNSGTSLTDAEQSMIDEIAEEDPERAEMLRQRLVQSKLDAIEDAEARFEEAKAEAEAADRAYNAAQDNEQYWREAWFAAYFLSPYGWALEINRQACARHTVLVNDVATLQREYNDVTAKLADLQASRNRMIEEMNKPVDERSGSEAQVWFGATSILEAADRRGAVQ